MNAAWNGLMIEALAYSGRIFARKDSVRRAERAAQALLATLSDEGGELLHVARRGEAKIGAYLDDYAGVILGFIELYRATGNAYCRRCR